MKHLLLASVALMISAQVFAIKPATKSNSVEETESTTVTKTDKHGNKTTQKINKRRVEKDIKEAELLEQHDESSPE